MGYLNKNEPAGQLPIKMALVLLSMVILIGLLSFSFKGADLSGLKKPGTEIKDSVASVNAFLAVYQVLMSPRCMNCHPSGDVPLQGDDSHLHTMNVQRGVDGNGVYALKCSNCHQPQNTAGLHAPPGNPRWHLPPADMRMVFQGRTPRQLAKQLLDPKQNGGKTRQQLIDHINSDGIVLGGWNPGDGRSIPPLSHEAFANLFKIWIEKGAYLPPR